MLGCVQPTIILLAFPPALPAALIYLILAVTGCLVKAMMHGASLALLAQDGRSYLRMAPELHPRVTVVNTLAVLACHASGLLPVQFQVRTKRLRLSAQRRMGAWPGLGGIRGCVRVEERVLGGGRYSRGLAVALADVQGRTVGA